MLSMFRVCHAALSIHRSLVVTCWERAGLLALLCVMFSCVFVTFPCGVLRQVRYLIVSIPDLYFLPCFNIKNEVEGLKYSCFVHKRKRKR